MTVRQGRPAPLRRPVRYTHSHHVVRPAPSRPRRGPVTSPVGPSSRVALLRRPMFTRFAPPGISPGPNSPGAEHRHEQPVYAAPVRNAVSPLPGVPGSRSAGPDLALAYYHRSAPLAVYRPP